MLRIQCDNCGEMSELQESAYCDDCWTSKVIYVRELEDRIWELQKENDELKEKFADVSEK